MSIIKNPFPSKIIGFTIVGIAIAAAVTIFFAKLIFARQKAPAYSNEEINA